MDSAVTVRSKPDGRRAGPPWRWLAAAVCAPGVLAWSPQEKSAQPYPAPQRPVAAIVSPSWGEAALRDRAGEVDQIARRLELRAGMTVADIGAGDGYDTLRLAAVVGVRGRVIAEDVTPAYLAALRRKAKAQGLGNVRTVLGAGDDPKLPAGSIDAAIMIHMYHEIDQPYALLHRLAVAFRAGGRIGVEELDRPTGSHGTPPALLVCEFEAVGYRKQSLAPLAGGLGYFAVFTAPTADRLPRPEDIKPCGGG